MLPLPDALPKQREPSSARPKHVPPNARIRFAPPARASSLFRLPPGPVALIKTHLGAGQDNLARHKDEQDDLGYEHAVHEAGEKLRFVLANVRKRRHPGRLGRLWLGRSWIGSARLRFSPGPTYARELAVCDGEALEADRKLDVAAPDHVLNLKVDKLDLKADLLDDARVLARGLPASVLGLGARDHHLARGKDERRGFGLADAQNHRREPLQEWQWPTNEHAERSGARTRAGKRKLAGWGTGTRPGTWNQGWEPGTAERRNLGRSTAFGCQCPHLGVVLGVPGAQRNRFQVQPHVQVHRRDNVSARCACVRWDEAV